MLNKTHLMDAYQGIKKIPDKSVDLVYVDVPYEIGVGGGGAFGESRKKFRKELKALDIINGFDYSILDDFVRVLKKVNIFIWCSRLQLLSIMNYFNDLDVEGGVSMELLFWGKSNAVPAVNNTFLPNVEYCLYFREKGVNLNHGYDIKSKYFISATNKADKEDFLHPTIKPLEYVKKHILHTTQEGDVVLDCFMGSGTTAEACVDTGRQFIGFEISPKYHKIANNRVNGINAHGQTSIFTNFELLGSKS